MEFETGILTPERLEPLREYLEDDKITNIDWNGSELWIKTIFNQCYRVDPSECRVTEDYIDTLIANITNSKSQMFNIENNRLEVENEDLHIRITAVHESIALNGNCLLIRKTTPKPRFTYNELISSGYIKEEQLNLLINCIISGCNLIIGGIPEAGKSEFGKYLSLYIPDNQVVVTIEDAVEWYYKNLKPDAACISLKVNDRFTYSEAISLCMRLNPDRILFTEARSAEVMDLVTLWSTGVPGICTIHAGMYDKIPDRILNMMPTRRDADRLENNIYDNLDVGVIIKKKKHPDGTATRYVDQIGFYERENGINRSVDYMIKNKVVADTLPEKILDKLEESGIKNPFLFPEELRR